MLRLAHLVEVTPNLRLAALFVSLHRLGQHVGLLRVPGGRLAALAHRHGDQYGQHQEQRMGHPVRQKNLEKQASHDTLLLVFSWAVLS